jgi:predicted SAM-dependent methyltransferase
MPSLNLCSGRAKMEGYLNVDANEEHKADLTFDIRQDFPLESDTYDEVLLFHAIEHIQPFFHRRIYKEIHRVLKPGGTFIMSYPEFRHVAQYWLENYKGSREFWGHVIYGRQENIFDFHVCPMDTDEVKVKLVEAGFDDLKHSTESPEVYNSIIRGIKGKPQLTYEDVLQSDIDKVLIV